MVLAIVNDESWRERENARRELDKASQWLTRAWEQFNSEGDDVETLRLALHALGHITSVLEYVLMDDDA